jgi:nitrate reductase NapE component
VAQEKSVAFPSAVSAATCVLRGLRSCTDVHDGSTPRSRGHSIAFVSVRSAFSLLMVSAVGGYVFVIWICWLRVYTVDQVPCWVVKVGVCSSFSACFLSCFVAALMPAGLDLR